MYFGPDDLTVGVGFMVMGDFEIGHGRYKDTTFMRVLVFPSCCVIMGEKLSIPIALITVEPAVQQFPCESA